ncbi:hypothetical protein WA158_001826 [Blastocystis sp. Blastoise]
MLRLLLTKKLFISSNILSNRFIATATGVTIVNNKETAEKVVNQLMQLKDEYHACDTEVRDIDMDKSPIGNGKLICASIYCGPQYDFGNGPRIWIDNLDESEELLLVINEDIDQ